jgi:hypothetical protein
MFLSALYIIFAVLLFLFYGADTVHFDDETDVAMSLKYKGLSDDAIVTSSTVGAPLSAISNHNLINHGGNATVPLANNTSNGASSAATSDPTGIVATQGSMIQVGSIVNPNAMARRDKFLS